MDLSTPPDPNPTTPPRAAAPSTDGGATASPAATTSSPAQPPPRPAVRLYQVGSEYFLLTDLAHRKTVEIFEVHPDTGILQFSAQQGRHLFPTAAEADEYLAGRGPPTLLCEAQALLGYLVVGGFAAVVMVEEARTTASLPGGHVVKQVSAVRWEPLRLRAIGPGPRHDTSRPDYLALLSMQTEFQLRGCHYYCETADISRPFPSPKSAIAPSWEFVWNRWLSKPFRQVGLYDLCPNMLQGLTEERRLTDLAGRRFSLLLICRRSRLHPGPRYIARGLNARSDPGNEIECEQLVYTHADGDGSQPQRWSSCVWRRGSVPIHWGVDQSKAVTLGSPDIVIPVQGTFRGTTRYFRRLQHRYYPRSQPGAAVEADTAASRAYPIFLLNLLRKGNFDKEKSEKKLKEAFECGIHNLRELHALNVQVVSFDWHELVNEKWNEKGWEVVQMLWWAVKDLVKEYGFTQGVVAPSTQLEATLQPSATRWGSTLMAHSSRQQQGLLRFNCADSLDRTNLASFFTASQVVVEQCRALGLQVGYTTAHPPAPLPPPAAKSSGMRSMHRAFKTGLKSAKKAASGLRSASRPASAVSDAQLASMTDEDWAGVAVPPGFEMRMFQGRSLYINHTKETTSWRHPIAEAAEAAAATDSGGGPATTKDPGEGGSGSGGEEAGGAEAGDDSAGDDPEREGPLAEADLSEWELLENPSVPAFKRRVMQELLQEMRHLFRISGDLNAQIYTNSGAMHAGQLELLCRTGAASTGAAVMSQLSNAYLAVQRRAANVMSDHLRHAAIEMLLGLKPHKHFCDMPLPYREDEAAAVPLDYPDSECEDDPMDKLTWPPDASRGEAALSEEPSEVDVDAAALAAAASVLGATPQGEGDVPAGEKCTPGVAEKVDGLVLAAAKQPLPGISGSAAPHGWEAAGAADTAPPLMDFDDSPTAAGCGAEERLSLPGGGVGGAVPASAVQAGAGDSIRNMRRISDQEMSNFSLE